MDGCLIAHEQFRMPRERRHVVGEQHVTGSGSGPGSHGGVQCGDYIRALVRSVEPGAHIHQNNTRTGEFGDHGVHLVDGVDGGRSSARVVGAELDYGRIGVCGRVVVGGGLVRREASPSPRRDFRLVRGIQFGVQLPTGVRRDRIADHHDGRVGRAPGVVRFDNAPAQGGDEHDRGAHYRPGSPGSPMSTESLQWSSPMVGTANSTARSVGHKRHRRSNDERASAQNGRRDAPSNSERGIGLQI
jgi:hypothetical protein